MKNYRASLTQSGTSSPVEKVAFSEIGEITWTRVGEGQATGECTGAFPEDLTTIHVTPKDAGGEVMFCSIAQRLNDDTIMVAMFGGDPAGGYDGWAVNISIVIDDPVYQTS